MENLMVVDDDFIKEEIKTEDEIKEEILEEETENDHDNFWEQYIDPSLARGSYVLEKVGRPKSNRSAAIGKANGNTTIDIENIIRQEIEIKTEDEINQEVIAEETPQDDFVSEDSLIEQENPQIKLIPNTSSQIQIPLQDSTRIPRLVLVNPEGNNSMESDDMNVGEAIENSTPPLCTRYTIPSDNSSSDFLPATGNPKEQSKESFVPQKLTLANSKPTTGRKRDRKQGTRQEIHEASAAAMSRRNKKQKKGKSKIQLDCYFCSEKQVKQSLLMRHITKHTTEKPYKCMICDVRFKQTYDQIQHVKIVHDGIKPFNCTINNCSYKAGRKGDLAKHMRSHNGEKPFKCGSCELSFRDDSKRIRHMNSVHKKLKLHKCSENGCKRQFARRHVLRDHINAVHKGLKPFECMFEGCAFRCARKDNLLIHGQKCKQNTENTK